MLAQSKGEEGRREGGETRARGRAQGGQGKEGIRHRVEGVVKLRIGATSFPLRWRKGKGQNGLGKLVGGGIEESGS